MPRLFRSPEPILGLLLCLLCCACGPRPEKPDIIILQTGRIFGNIYPLETKSISPLQYYPYLAGYVNRVRAEAASTGAQVLLIDSGDSLGGSFASHATQCANVVTFFNAMRYDAVFLGNLDANTDPAVIARLEMPVLVPFQQSSGASPLAATHTAISLDKGPYTIRILANFHGDADPAEFPQRFPIWFGPARDDIRPVRDHSAFLSRPVPDGRIPLTLFHWMKFEPSTLPPPFVLTLKTQGIDAILAHRIYHSGVRDTWERDDLAAWPIPVSENILRQNGGFTVARLDLKRRSTGWAPAAPPALVQMTANTAPADSVIIDRINQLAPALRAADETLASLDRPLDEAAILPAYMKMLAARHQADAVLFSASSVRSPIPAGPLTANRLYAALPWTNPIVRLRLTAEQLGRAATLPGHALLVRSTVPQRPVLVTSLYFARLLQDALGLPDHALEVLPDSDEFENAKAMVRANPRGLADPSIPEGWSYAVVR